MAHFGTVKLQMHISGRVILLLSEHNALRAKLLAVGWVKRFLTFLLGTPQVGILSQHVELTTK